MGAATPLMRQYFALKEQYPESILLFQVGDFYEIFFDDAHSAASILGIALTQRGEHNHEPIPMCGVPIHTVDHYLLKLVQAGARVAICQQLSPPQPGTVVERDVTQVLTPGTLTDPHMLEEKSASYCASCYVHKESISLVFVEILTGHMFATVFPSHDTTLLGAELARFTPDEVILDAQAPSWLVTYVQSGGYVTSRVPYEATDGAWDDGYQQWGHHIQQSGRSLLEHSYAADMALYHIYAYIRKNHASALHQCRHVYWYSPEDFLLLDAATQRNLEIVRNMHERTRKNTLFSVLDQAATPMGSRTVKKWMTRPLISRQRIEQRHDAVSYITQAYALRESLYSHLSALGDIERIVGRIGLGKAQAHDYRSLRNALRVIPEIRSMLADCPAHLLSRLASQIADFSPVLHELEQALEEHGSDWIIRKGYDAELDRLRDLVEDASNKLLALEQSEQERTGISSLKIRYNSVHGYVIEVTKPNLHLVPEDYIRVQTLVNRERYTCEQLRDVEHDMRHAHNTITQRQNELYATLIEFVATYVPQLKKAAQACAHIDALISFAYTALHDGYTRPEMHDGQDIQVRDGRHPVVARHLGHNFVPNDVSLTDDEPLWIITGPNMGGKSTFLRQSALHVIMAQAGAFVPARHARLPVVDRIFTRIGAADNVAHGKSTFLVEMEETALICNQATDRSLVILDEVGRGTSTYDGYAIAQAVVEYMYHNVQARCLFATHYHELLELSHQYPGIAAYHAASRRTDKGIVLLHKIVHGVADGSFGVEVARQAHLPAAVLDRAHDILSSMKEHQSVTPASSTSHQPMHEQKVQQMQQTITQLRTELEHAHSTLQQLRHIDVDNMTPKQALDTLSQLKNRE